MNREELEKIGVLHIKDTTYRVDGVGHVRMPKIESMLHIYNYIYQAGKDAGYINGMADGENSFKERFKTFLDL